MTKLSTAELDTDEEIAALIQYEEQSYKEERNALCNSILVSWGDHSGVDHIIIRRMLDAVCSLGKLIKKNNKTPENTETSSANRPREYFGDEVYQQIDSIRRGIGDLDREIMDARYRYNLGVREITKGLKIGKDRYYKGLDRIYSEIESKMFAREYNRA